MPKLTGRIDPQHGATVLVKVMQSPEYVLALKKAGRQYSTPTTILAILDTGASATAIDRRIVSMLGLLFRDSVMVHTPSTGADCVYRDQYDATVVIGESETSAITATIPVIESEFASRGFFALIGRDILSRCVLTYDGPSETFTLSW